MTKVISFCYSTTPGDEVVASGGIGSRKGKEPTKWEGPLEATTTSLLIHKSLDTHLRSLLERLIHNLNLRDLAV